MIGKLALWAVSSVGLHKTLERQPEMMPPVPLKSGRHYCATFAVRIR